MQIWAGTGAEVSSLTEGWFRTQFPNDVIQPTMKIFEGFNGARQPAIGQVSAEASFHGGPKVPIILYILPDDCMSLLSLEDMGKMKLVMDTRKRTIYRARQTPSSVPTSEVSIAPSTTHPTEAPMPSQTRNTAPGCSQS
ncbi:MAG: hypothetical protein GY696_11625 [Gammaproteobacteria bacterium]|nr:hypothetical protein [Gammaproteobacteria bacterium]